MASEWDSDKFFADWVKSDKRFAIQFALLTVWCVVILILFIVIATRFTHGWRDWQRWYDIVMASIMGLFGTRTAFKTYECWVIQPKDVMKRWNDMKQLEATVELAIKQSANNLKEKI